MPICTTASSPPPNPCTGLPFEHRARPFPVPGRRKRVGPQGETPRSMGGILTRSDGTAPIDATVAYTAAERPVPGTSGSARRHPIGSSAAGALISRPGPRAPWDRGGAGQS